MSEIKTSCEHCHEHIAFEAEHAGRVADCPHCGLETRLIIPKAPARAVRAQPAMSPAMISAPDKTGMGNNLVMVGYISAIFMPLIGFFIGLYLMTKNESGHGAAVMAVSILAFLFWIAVFAGG